MKESRAHSFERFLAKEVFYEAHHDLNPEKLSLSALLKLAAIPFDAGILDIQPNPMGGSLVINYDPKKIDVLEYLETMAFNSEIEEFIRNDRRG
jgi:hypothetical protein